MDEMESNPSYMQCAQRMRMYEMVPYTKKLTYTEGNKKQDKVLEKAGAPNEPRWLTTISCIVSIAFK